MVPRCILDQPSGRVLHSWTSITYSTYPIYRCHWLCDRIVCFRRDVWCCGLGVTYEAWGIGGVIIGLVIAGIGIVPVAMLAVLLHGEWQALIVFVILIVLTFGLRALGFWLAKKVDERAARLSFQREMQAA